VLLTIGAGWGCWQWLLARTGPEVKLLPSMVSDRLADHEGTYVSLSRMPLMLREAVVATEDQSFWSNPGIDPVGIARAIVVDVSAGQLVEGGSTITQQLARDMLLNPKKTLGRKIKEMLLALVITRYYSKDAILEMYLNEIYLGHDAYGVARAARVYFGVAPSSLTPAQSVMLAGLPRGPSLYNPLVNWQAARERQREVLDSMVDAGYISASRADQLYAQPIDLSH
jgi:penicillin-binding protein 1A